MHPPHRRGRLARLLAACAIAVLTALPAWAQHWSEDPSDATTGLTANVNDNIAPAMPTAANCTGNSLNGAFSMLDVASVTSDALLPYAPCSYTPAPYATPNPPKDIWFRMDPAHTDAVYRFTLFGTGSPAMTRGAIALYEAPNASGPFRLLSCSTGGGNTATLASAEATCITPGHKIYVRVWDLTTPTPANSNFNICVRGQRTSTMPDRGADETPCAARTITAVPTFNTGSNNPPIGIHYAYSCEEGFLPAGGNQTGGDLWVKLVVPASGHVIIKASSGAISSANQIGTGPTVANSMGVSTYLADDCADYGTFREIEWTSNMVSPGGATAASANLNISCLPPGATLYVRFYSIKQSMQNVKRFGVIRFEWMAGSGVGGMAPPPYAQPCGATPLTVGAASCTGTLSGITYGSCGAPGIPPPTCGGNLQGDKPSVWYKFTAPPSGLAVIDAKAGAAPATQPAIALYTSNALGGDPGEGCNLRLGLVACDDRQGEGADARIIQGNLIPDQVYYVRVWARSGAPEGNFTLCVTSPPPPAGSCWYMIDLYASSGAGTLAMEVTIPPAATVTYATTGNDPSETMLVAVPVGGTASFYLVPRTGVNGIGTNGYYFYALWQVGSADTLWWDDGGYGVAGPTPGPNDNYTVTDACSPRPNRVTDCFGMRTVCLDLTGASYPYYPVTGQMDNRGKPMNVWAPDEYEGYTYHPHTGSAIDLAGANMGCLDGETQGIQWMVVRPEEDGKVGFLLYGTKVSPTPNEVADLDFAIWDLGMLDYNLPPDPNHINGYHVCPPQTAPIRCSSARATSYTGLVAGMDRQVEGHGGLGWLEPLDVVQGHAYLIAMVPANVTGRINYSLNWTLYEDAAGVADPGIISCAPLVLPVELLFLTGTVRSGEVDLAWATASEKHSSHFIVERSADAVHYAPIGQVGAAGNSQHPIHYAFTDPQPLAGVNYYRLKQVDTDGSSEHSNSIAVWVDRAGGQMLAWPNPVQDQLHVAMDLHGREHVQVQVLDASGRLVQAWQASSADGQLVIDAQALEPGAYMARVSTADGSVLGTARFVKN